MAGPLRGYSECSSLTYNWPGIRPCHKLGEGRISGACLQSDIADRRPGSQRERSLGRRPPLRWPAAWWFLLDVITGEWILRRRQ